MSENSEIPIRYWAEEDQPREKLMRLGKSALSNAELLGIVLGSGSKHETAVGLARRILQSTANNLQQVGKLSVMQLMQFHGMGHAKAITVAASLELGRRSLQTTMAFPVVSSSLSVFQLMQPFLGDLAHEEFWILYLNNANKVLHKLQLSKGGITGTVVDVRLAFKVALEFHATSIILTHNHPAGTLAPSDADRTITKKIKYAGECLDIRVLDHIIITEKHYFSFADEGIL